MFLLPTFLVNKKVIDIMCQVTYVIYVTTIGDDMSQKRYVSIYMTGKISYEHITPDKK